MDHLTLLKKLFVAFPAIPIQEETIAVYLERLSKYDLDVLEWAINHALDGANHLPAIGTIVQLAGERKAANKAWSMPDDAHLLEDKDGGLRYTKIYKTSREEERQQLRRWNAVNRRNKQEKII